MSVGDDADYGEGLSWRELVAEGFALGQMALAVVSEMTAFLVVRSRSSSGRPSMMRWRRVVKYLGLIQR